MVVDLVTAELDRVHERIAGRFGRAEPRAQVREYVSGLVAGLERKNGWTLAERAGEAGPDGMQRPGNAQDTPGIHHAAQARLYIHANGWVVTSN
jgi:hypothetical protein